MVVCTCGRASGEPVCFPELVFHFPGKRKEKRAEAFADLRVAFGVLLRFIPQSHRARALAPRPGSGFGNGRAAFVSRDQNTKCAQVPLQGNCFARLVCAREIMQCLTVGWTQSLPVYPT